MADKETKDDDQAIVARIRKRFQIAADAEMVNRALALSDIRSENGEQWEPEAQASREEDGRPCLTINKIAGAVKQILGAARQNKLAIKVRPVDDQSDPKVAELLTGLIRNIENTSAGESAYDHAFECAVKGGWGYFRIITDYASEDVFDQDICIERVPNQFSVYPDPASSKQDGSDMRWCIVSEVRDKETFAEEYPDAATSGFDSSIGEASADWFTSEGVRVVEYFERSTEKKTLLLLQDGKTVFADDVPAEALKQGREMGAIVKEREVDYPKITWYKATGAEILDRKDWAGKYIPVIPVLGEETWVDGRRVLRSAIRWAKDPQVLYNWARSNAVETLAMAPRQPFIGTPKMFEGHEHQWAQAHRKPMPYLLANPDPQVSGVLPQRQMMSNIDTGALQEAQMAADDIKATTGIYDASLGARGNETSGRAIIARQSEGDNATFIFTDNLGRAMKQAGRILVDLIPKIYDTERVVRLMNQDGSEGWATINQQDPMTGQKMNDLSVGKYDVVVDVGPSYKTKRLEAADGMIQLSQAAPQFAQIIIPRIAKNLDWPEADEIAEEMTAMSQPQQGPDPAMQMAEMKMQQDQARGQIDMAKAQMDMEIKKMDFQIKQMDLMIKERQVNTPPQGGY